jgi:putative ABC transport system permease protein
LHEHDDILQKMMKDKISEKIPKGTLRILHWFCPNYLHEEIEGDLIQKFNRDVKAFGEKRAKRRLLWNVVRFFRPGILLRNQIRQNSFSNMFIINLKFSWRSIHKHRVFSSVNLLGLALGISVFLLILNYALFERSYDHFFYRHADVVRIAYTRLIDNQSEFSKAQVFPAVGETLKEEIPEVETYTRMFPISTHVEGVLSIEYDGEKKAFAESSIFAVDPTFLKIFPLKLLHGDVGTALVGDNKVLLSESVAVKYFNTIDVVNKTIHWDGMGDYTITGVFEEMPVNSHMKLSVITSWMNVYEETSNWNWDGFYTYLLLRPNTNHKSLQAKIQQVLDNRMLKPTQGELGRVASRFFLQPLTTIHLGSNLMGELQSNSSKRLINTLLIVAGLILFLALANYINLSIARGIKRAKEVGVRKMIGSSRIQLMALFFSESFLLSFFAFLFGVALVFMLLPYFNSLSGKMTEIVLWKNPVQFIAYSFIGVTVFAWLAGYYPSRLLTSSKTVHALKGGTPAGGKNKLRKVLLVVQFLITIVLVTCGLLIQKQVSYMQHHELGFSSNLKIVVKSFAEAGAEVDSAFISKIESLKSRLKEKTAIKSVTITSNIPGRENEWIGRLRKSEQEKELISIARTRVDTDFIATYGLALSAGRNFGSDNPKQIILNQAAVRMLGFKSDQDAVGGLLMKDYEVVGVVKDFYQKSLHDPVQPFMFTPSVGYMKFLTLDISGTNLPETIALIEKEWHNAFDKPFEYFFLDEFFNRQYDHERQLGYVFNTFSIVGVLIASLGLIGFSYFVTHQRIREISIRKTLGASFYNLISLLSSEFIQVLIASGVIATCISFYAITSWLENYPVRMEMSWIDITLPVLIVGALAYSSIILILIRSVKINPIEVLKNE